MNTLRKLFAPRNIPMERALFVQHLLRAFADPTVDEVVVGASDGGKRVITRQQANLYISSIKADSKNVSPAERLKLRARANRLKLQIAAGGSA